MTAGNGRGRHAWDIWLDRRIMTTGAILLFVMVFLVWQVVRDDTVPPSEIERRLLQLDEDCREYAGTAIRQQILTQASPIEMDELDEILDDAERLTPQDCQTMNLQMRATAP